MMARFWLWLLFLAASRLFPYIAIYSPGTPDDDAAVLAIHLGVSEAALRASAVDLLKENVA